MEATKNDLYLELWFRARNSGALRVYNSDGTYVALKDIGNDYLLKALYEQEKKA